MEEDGGVIRFSFCGSLSSLFCLTLVNIFNSLFFFYRVHHAEISLGSI